MIACETSIDDVRRETELRKNSAEPKWAAVVDDRLIPLPRRRLNARDILAQAGAADASLLRDYNQPDDALISVDSVVDLAQGNVFRTISVCEDRIAAAPPRHGAKLAFVMDDAWEVTVQPKQTLESLRGLFDLTDEAEILRDYESPHDEAIPPGAEIRFEDGMVFRAQTVNIAVKVNNQPVQFAKRRVTGLDVKQTAVAQGVAIEVGFVLYQVKSGGGLGPAITDSELLILKKHDEFRCVAPDDNS